MAEPFSGASNVVDVQKCNACHDALATTFHSPDRGGSVVVCRMCHVTTSGGSHLEMQSRGIDSYVHAIHEFQAFDFDQIDFTDPVEAKRYEEHIGFVFPVFTLDDCEACHNEGTYNVPDQSQSLGGLLSASDTNATYPRDINFPAYITGPASRACGGCHRAYMIKEEHFGDLAAFNQHTNVNGYLIEYDSNETLYAVIDKIMGLFN